MKATNVFIILTLATAVCAAIGVGVYFNHSEDFAAESQRPGHEPLELAQADRAFGPEINDPGSPSLAVGELAADDDAINGVAVALASEEDVEETAVEEAARSIDFETLQAARVAFEQRDHEAVLKLLGETGAVEGSGYDVHYLRGLTLRYLGRFEESADEMDLALTDYPGSVRALVNSARTLMELQRFVQAEERAERAVELNPEDADAWNVLGRTKLNLQDVTAAIEAFDRAAELDPQHAHALNNKGYALLQQQEWQAAADALETAVQLRDDVAWFHNNLGVCYEQLARPMDAAMAWQRALELQPDYAKAAVSLARIEPQMEAIAAQLAGAGVIEATTQEAEKSDSKENSDVEGEETLQAGSDSQPQTDVVDVDGMEAGSDSRSSHSGSDATEETPEGSVSPQ